MLDAVLSGKEILAAFRNTRNRFKPENAHRGQFTMNLFDTIHLGDYQLSNRAFMAPLTRGRASPEGVPNRLMAEYYEQRASAGLIISEATAVSAMGHGWLNAPLDSS